MKRALVIGLNYTGSEYALARGEQQSAFHLKTIDMDFLTENKRIFICAGAYLVTFAWVALKIPLPFVPPLVSTVWLAVGKFKEE